MGLIGFWWYLLDARSFHTQPLGSLKGLRSDEDGPSIPAVFSKQSLDNFVHFVCCALWDWHHLPVREPCLGLSKGPKAD